MKKSVSPNRRNPKESHAEGGDESGPSAIKNRVNALDVSKQDQQSYYFRGTQRQPSNYSTTTGKKFNC